MDYTSTDSIRAPDTNPSGRQALVDLIDLLDRTGPSKPFEFQHSRSIVVIGVPSAARSSLLEVISQVKIPRDALPDKNCPMELRMKRLKDGSWTCKVKIRIESLKDGIHLPLGEWKEFGIDLTLKDPSAIGVLIKSPKRYTFETCGSKLYPSSFQSGSHHHPCKYSNFNTSRFDLRKRVVCLDVKRSGSQILKSLDFPIISFDNGINPDQPARQLDLDCISEDRVILLALDIMDEAGNHYVKQLARSIDPQGKRTMGALITSDGLDLEQSYQWLDAFLDPSNTKPFPPKYQATWSSDLKHSPRTINDGGSALPVTTISRKNIDTPRDRLGVPNLTGGLESLARKMSIESNQDLTPSLPNEKVRIVSSLEQSRTNRLVADVVQSRCQDFSDELKSRLTGQIGHQSLWLKINAIFDKFTAEAFAEMSVFVPVGGRESHLIRELKEMDQNRNHHRSLDSKDSKNPDPYDYESSRPKLYLSDIRARLRSHAHPTMWSRVPFETKTYLMTSPLLKWKRLARTMHEEVVGTLASEIRVLTQKHFSGLPNLEHRVCEMTLMELEKVRITGIQKLIEAMGVEQVPYTQCYRALLHLREDRLKDLGVLRTIIKQAASARTIDCRWMNAGLKSVKVDTKYDRTTISSSSSSKRVEEDNWDQEMEMAAEASAYQTIAFQRFTSIIPMIIDEGLIQALGEVPLVELFREAFLSESYQSTGLYHKSTTQFTPSTILTPQNGVALKCRLSSMDKASEKLVLLQ